ncbi:unnamed protein product [Tenebrio molitor]|nr:unnamed protein product [Tenebrio molitor]
MKAPLKTSQSNSPLPFITFTTSSPKKITSSCFTYL